MSSVAPVRTVAERIAAIEKECSLVWSSYGISMWERQRLSEWKAKPTLSAKQLEILAEIEKKAFPEREDG